MPATTTRRTRRKMVRYNLSLHSEVAGKLNRYAASQHRSRNNTIEWLLKQKLDELDGAVPPRKK